MRQKKEECSTDRLRALRIGNSRRPSGLRPRVVLVQLQRVEVQAQRRVTARDDDALILAANAEVDIAVRQYHDGAFADEHEQFRAMRGALLNPGLEIGVERL